jgi:hypothetical protein
MVLHVLSACRDVVRLKLMVAHDPRFWPLLYKLRPQRLSIHARALQVAHARYGFTGAFFQQISHLWLLGDEWLGWPLSTLPSLEYLALDYAVSDEAHHTLREILAHAQRLKILLLLVDGGDYSLVHAISSLNLHRFRDPRLRVSEPFMGAALGPDDSALWEAVENEGLLNPAGRGRARSVLHTIMLCAPGLTRFIGIFYEVYCHAAFPTQKETVPKSTAPSTCTRTLRIPLLRPTLSRHGLLSFH